jgi:hypothetical protein
MKKPMKKPTIHILLTWLAAILLFLLFAVFGDYVRSLYAGAVNELVPPKPPASAVVAQRIATWAVAGILYLFGAIQAILGLIRGGRKQRLWTLPPALFYLYIALLYIWGLVT